MVTNTKLAENSAANLSQERFDRALAKLEQVCTKLKERSQLLEKAQTRASDELGLHIRNLGRILERQE